MADTWNIIKSGSRNNSIITRDFIDINTNIPGSAPIGNRRVSEQSKSFLDANTNIPGGGRFSGEQSNSFLDANTNIPGGGRFSPNQTDAPSQDPIVDRRVRIRAKTTAAKAKVYGPNQAGNILAPLYRTNGLIFPYTPTINVNHVADWSPYELTHTNYHTQAFSNSRIEDFTITGNFTAQNKDESLYTFTAIHFFRTMTKMYFGSTDPQRGATPPVLALSGHGTGMFNDLPVVIKSVAFDYLDSVDMVKVVVPNLGLDAWIPTMITISVTLGVTHDLRRVRDEFNLDQFRTGQLLKNNKGFM